MARYQQIEMIERKEVVELLRLKSLRKISPKEFQKRKKELSHIWNHGSLYQKYN